MTITPYLKKRISSDNYGIINLRITKNRKSEYYSLKINLKERLWNDKKKEVRKTDEVDYLELNLKIQEEIDKLKKSNNVSDKELTGKKRVSFLIFFEDYLDELTSLNKLGTYKKYNTTLQHLKEYLKKNNRTDLPFADIDFNLIADFDLYLKKLQLKTNTRNGYLKCGQKLFNLALKKKTFRTYENPFDDFKFIREPVEKRRMSIGQIQNLISSQIDFGTLNYETRVKFFIQIYGQGLRVSDLFTIRFNNISFDSWKSRIYFFQFKTKKKHTIQFGIDIVKQLFYFVDKDHYFKMYYVDKYSFKWKDKDYNLSLPKIESEIIRIRPISIKRNDDNWKNISDIYYSILGNLYQEQLKIIYDFSLNNKTKFIVPWLNESIFEKVEFNDNTILSKKQYNHFQSRIVVYNRNLKRLEQYTGTTIRITSHTPRHTYTNLLLKNADVYSISKGLGHSKLSITENYLNDFDIERVDNDNTDLFRRINLTKAPAPPKRDN